MRLAGWSISSKVNSQNVEASQRPTAYPGHGKNYKQVANSERLRNGYRRWILLRFPALSALICASARLEYVLHGTTTPRPKGEPEQHNHQYTSWSRCSNPLERQGEAVFLAVRWALNVHYLNLR